MRINTKTISEARKEIDRISGKNKGKKIIVKAQDEEFNRKILENKKVDILLSPETGKNKEKLKQRAGGLNEILCKIAKQNNIAIGIDLDEVKKVGKEEKAVLLSRIIQNIKLCKKAGTKIVFFGKYDKRNLFSFLLTLGVSTNQAKQIINTS